MSGPIRLEPLSELIARDAARVPSRGTAQLVTRIHIALTVILGVGAALLSARGCGGSDLCPGPVLGLFAAGTAVILVIALAVRAVAHRSSPLVIIDVLAASVLAPALLSSLLSLYLSPVTLAALLLVGLLLVGAVLAVGEVGAHRLERIGLIVVLVVLIGIFVTSGLARALTGVVPLIVLATAIWGGSAEPDAQPG